MFHIYKLSANFVAQIKPQRKLISGYKLIKSALKAVGARLIFSIVYGSNKKESLL